MNYLSPPSLFILLLVSAADGTAAKDPFLDAVEKRQAAVKVADVTFEMKEFRPKGSPSLRMDKAHPGAKYESPLPRQLLLQSTNRLVIQGRMSRFEGAHPIWDAGSGEATPLKVIRVSNAKLAKAFYPTGMGANKQARGAISNSSMNSALQMYYMRPLGLAYRGLDRELTVDPASTFTHSPVRHEIDGKDCVGYFKRLGKTDLISYFVAPQIDHNVVRMLDTREGKVFWQFDIRYVENPVCGWVPASWVEHWYTPTGLLQRRTEVEVVSTKLNEAIPEERFDIVFPPDTLVWHAKEGDFFQVQEDGRLRLRSATGSESPVVIPQREVHWLVRHLWLLTGCFVAFALGLLLFRRSRKSRPRP